MSVWTAVHWGDPMPHPETKARYVEPKDPDKKPFIHFYAPKEAEQFKGELAESWRTYGEHRFDPGVPLKLDVILVFARPSGHMGTGRNAGTVKPQFLSRRPGKGGSKNSAGRRTGADADNCLKIIQDALHEVAYENDGEITDTRARKFFLDQVSGVDEPCIIVNLQLDTEHAYAYDGPQAASDGGGNPVTLALDVSPEQPEVDDESPRVPAAGDGEPVSGFPGI